MTLLDVNLRRIFATEQQHFQAYERYGVRREDLSWLPLSHDPASGYETFLIRFNPGAASLPHEHSGGEEFLVLEGELEDCDGQRLRAGDFVSYAPGSQHYSVSPTGCVLLVILRGPGNRTLNTGPSGTQA